MKPDIRFSSMLAGALVVSGVLFHQEKEMCRVRSAIEELIANRNDEAAVIAATTNRILEKAEELRREAAEVQHLRAEIAQLRREMVEVGAVQASLDKLVSKVSINPTGVYHGADSFQVRGGSGYAAANAAVISRARSMAESSPEEAARWVAALSPGKEQDAAALAVIERWSRSDPVAAAAWTTQFTEGTLREHAVSQVAREWGLRDWNATAGWLEKLPMGPSRDAAIGAFVTSADGHDIKLALEWANRMEAPESRVIRVEETARRWLREDRAAARVWLEKAQLPSGVGERLLSANNPSEGR